MSTSNSKHAERYRGKHLLRLLAAICVPAALLYLRLVLTFAATESGTTATQARWLLGAGVLVLIVFFLAQLAGAWYMRTLLPESKSRWRRGLEFTAVFLLGLLFSITGAVMLEAFGYSLFMHLRTS